MEKEQHKQAKHAHEHLKHETRHARKPGGMALTDKLFLLTIIASAVYIGYLFFQEEIVGILKMNPYVWGFFTHIIGEISERTILGLLYASFFGSLFFIFIPLEMIFLYYLTLGYSPPLLIALTMLGYLAGLSLDYLFGFAVGARLVKFFVGGKFEKFHDMVTKWGGIVVLLGNFILFPIQPVSVVIGSARYSYKKFFIFSAVGLFMKLFALIMLFVYFKDRIPGLI
jgi:membrane protein YqaA with SNARE-associated domain